jgi:hypothetical protein
MEKKLSSFLKYFQWHTPLNIFFFQKCTLIWIFFSDFYKIELQFYDDLLEFFFMHMIYKWIIFYE